ncbi:hypothetical protein A2U01_0067825 [Trifolium medium]|uniref:Uncharacterized protein n=1 Tax=Trifolium medium TaxID=97028 RepID=A0A392SEG3_9FABA|nr:hypothetical protein [Trifolium medium]
MRLAPKGCCASRPRPGFEAVEPLPAAPRAG